MNEFSLTTPSPSFEEKTEEEPRKWWENIWHRLHSLVRPPPDAAVLREVVEEIIDEPLSESGISPAERMLLANIMNLREREAADCMIHRTDIVAADVDSPLKEIIDLMAAHAHSRIPIYRGTLDDIIGMVHIKDILPCLAYQQQRSISDLLRPVLFVAPSMPASRLFLQMRQNRQHMAFVVDEFGGIDGLVTIEDLIEEIVGEIDDEHDAPTGPLIIKRADGTLLIDARLDVEEFEEQTGITLSPVEGQDINTLGGYVAGLAGRVPHIGEIFSDRGELNFEVLEMDQTRIKRLRVRNLRRHDTSETPAKPL